MSYIWCCTCGKHTPCSSEDMKLGSVWHCVECHKTFGRLKSAPGPAVWVEIDPVEAIFHNLFYADVHFVNKDKRMIEDNIDWKDLNNGDQVLVTIPATIDVVAEDRITFYPKGRPYPFWVHLERHEADLAKWKLVEKLTAGPAIYIPNDEIVEIVFVDETHAVIKFESGDKQLVPHGDLRPFNPEGKTIKKFEY